MADRSITARLRVAYDASGLNKFSKGLKDAAAEGKRTSTSVGRDWDELSKRTARLGSIGDSLTTKVTLPILAIGAGMAKLSMDFSSTFDQMGALAGVASSEIDGLKDAVLGISEATGRGPQELADALMQIRGAGLTGKAALDTLDVSARAAAAGLGSTVEVANAVTNVLNGYGAANISAAEAGDILVAAVTSAKVEASQMAPQFGRLIPVAAELGVSFDDVAGALAFLTVSSGDAAQASTGLSGVLTKLLNPSIQGKEALRQIGLEASDLRDMLGQRGLDGTIIELRKRLGDAGFRTLIDDSEAMKAALQMTGASAEQFGQIMDDVENSTGALDEAFKRTDNDTRKAQIAWAQAQGAAIRLGEAIVPIVTVLADLAAAAAKALGGLPDELRTAIVMFGALLAAIGPIAKVTSRVSEGLAMYSRWLETSSLGTGRFGDQMSKLPAIARGTALALGAVGVAMAAIQVIAGQRESRVRGWVEEQVGDPGTLDEVRSSIQAVKRELDELDDREGKGRLLSLGDNNVFLTGGDADRQERIDQLRESLGELEAQEEQLIGQQADSAAAYAGTTGAMADLNEETTNAVQELQNWSDAIAAQFDPLLGFTNALVQNQDAQRAVTEAEVALQEAIANHGPTSDEAAEAQRNLDAAMRESTGSAVSLTSAAAQLEAGIEAGTVSVADAKAQLGAWVRQGLISQSTAREMGRQFDIAALKAVALGGTDPHVNVSTSGLNTAIGQFDSLARSINNALRAAGAAGNIHVSVGGGGGLILHEGGVVPGPRGKELLAVVQAGEEMLALDDPRHSANLGSGNLARLTAPMSSATSLTGGGGGDTFVFNVGVVGSQREFDRMVQRAFNTRQRKGRGMNAA